MAEAINDYIPYDFHISEFSPKHITAQWKCKCGPGYKFEVMYLSGEEYVSFDPAMVIEGGVRMIHLSPEIGDLQLKVKSIRESSDAESELSESSITLDWEDIFIKHSDFRGITKHHIAKSVIHFEMPAVLDAVGAASIIVDEDFTFEAPRNYIVDTSVEPLTGTLPSDAEIGFTSHAYDADADGTWDVNNFTLSTEGDETINGSSDDYVADFKGGHLMIIRKTLTDWFVRLAIFFFLLSGVSADGRFVWEKNNIEMNPDLSISVDKIKARSSGTLLSIADSDGTTIAVFSTSGLSVETISVSDYYVTSYFNSLSFDELDAVTADIDILNVGQADMTTLVVDFSSMSDVDITTLTVGTMSVSTADITILQTERIMSGFFYSAFGELGITTDIIIDGNTLRFQSGLLTEINPE